MATIFRGGPPEISWTGDGFVEGDRQASPRNVTNGNRWLLAARWSGHATYVIWNDDAGARDRNARVVVAACRCCIVVGVWHSLVRFRLPWAC